MAPSERAPIAIVIAVESQSHGATTFRSRVSIRVSMVSLGCLQFHSIVLAIHTLHRGDIQAFEAAPYARGTSEAARSQSL